MATISGGDKVGQLLEEIIRQLDVGGLQVGFLQGATYADGTPVAQVAFWNEYGTTISPARPFFRRMIASESPGWGAKLAGAAKFTNYDGVRAMSLLGEDIAGALQQSIATWQDPPNAKSTVERKGFNKPLIETSHMQNSVGYQVIT